MSIATQLYRVQIHDLAIAQRLTRIQAIQALLGDDEQVQAAQRVLDDAEKALKPFQIRSRDLELEMEGIAQKIKLADENLYSGRIKNPKEMTEVQDEIAALQRHRSQLEGELLDAMIAIDEGQTSAAQARETLDAITASKGASNSDLLAERKQLATEIAAQETLRAEAATTVDAASLKIYDALRPRKAGRAVALLKGNSCAACGIEQTTMLAQQVWQGRELVYCGNCGRILAGSA